MPARLRNGVLPGLAALACGFAVAACGSSKPKISSHTSHGSPFLAFSQCMRTHGVTNFPDPSGTGGLNLPNGFNTQSPAFKAAQSTCFKLMPGGGPNNQKASAAKIKLADETAQCMRSHGVSGFPDPIIATGLPNLDPANYSVLEAGGGIITAIPKSIDPQSPAFASAAKACKFR